MYRIQVVSKAFDGHKLVGAAQFTTGRERPVFTKHWVFSRISSLTLFACRIDVTEQHKMVKHAIADEIADMHGEHYYLLKCCVGTHSGRGAAGVLALVLQPRFLDSSLFGPSIGLMVETMTLEKYAKLNQ